VTDPLTERMLAEVFRFPDVSGKSVLVHGLGGGCDVITAFAVSLQFGPAARILYGNTKVGGVGPVREVTPHIVTPATPAPAPGVRPGGCGTAAIDHSTPRDAHGSPLIVRLGGEGTEPALVEEVRSLGFDLLVGVDAGGDSVAAQDGRGHLERDQRMLNVLQRTGIPLLHAVVAPGCDGESTAADLRASLGRLVAGGRYRGCFALAPLLPTLRAQSFGLAESRTPRIILAAADGALPTAPDGTQTVPRGCRTAVPASWLAHAFVFEPEPPCSS
jgi:hypothetical protein